MATPNASYMSASAGTLSVSVGTQTEVTRWHFRTVILPAADDAPAVSNPTDPLQEPARREALPSLFRFTLLRTELGEVFRQRP
jgi:hypothetical protein